GEAAQDGIEPAAAARAAGDDAEFAAEAVEVFGKALVDRGEPGAADAGGVGLADADDALDGDGRQAGTGAGAAGGGVRRGDEGEGAEVDVEQGTLGAFEEDGFTGFPRIVEDRDGIGDVRAQA